MLYIKLLESSKTKLITNTNVATLPKTIVYITRSKLADQLIVGTAVGNKIPG